MILFIIILKKQLYRKNDPNAILFLKKLLKTIALP